VPSRLVVRPANHQQVCTRGEDRRFGFDCPRDEQDALPSGFAVPDGGKPAARAFDPNQRVDRKPDGLVLRDELVGMMEIRRREPSGSIVGIAVLPLT
jgi:hypothetical protein